MTPFYVFHAFISLFGFFGFLLAPKIHAPFNAAVLAHWLTNNNRCMLSGEYKEENGFTQSLFEKIGVPFPSTPFLQNALTYALLLVPMMLSILRAQFGI